MTKRMTVLTAVMMSGLALAAPPAKGGMAQPAAGPQSWGDGPGPNREELQRKMHMMAVVGISDALGLSEADTLKMSERLKGFEAKRRPIREGMHEAMKSLKAAADGDTAAQSQVDANVQKVLDGRSQMAALDKDLYTSLAQGQSPDKRAKLALFMAQLGQHMRGFGGKGRHHGGEFER